MVIKRPSKEQAVKNQKKLIKGGSLYKDTTYKFATDTGHENDFKD